MNARPAIESLRRAERVLTRIEKVEDWARAEVLDRVLADLLETEALLREIVTPPLSPMESTGDLRSTGARVRLLAARVKDLIEAGCAHTQASLNRAMVSQAGYAVDGGPAAGVAGSVAVEG